MPCPAFRSCVGVVQSGAMSTAATRTNLDLSDPAVVAEPYAALAAARTDGPIVWSEDLGMFLTTTHQAANDVLRDRKLGRVFRPKSQAEDDAWTVFDWLHADSILDSEPPKHTRLRRLVAGAFGRGHVQRMGPRIEAIAAELLDDLERRLEADGRVDVLENFAEPLPVLVICELLGAPKSDWKQLRDWSQAIVKMYEVAPSDEARANAQQASQEFADWVGRLAAERVSALERAAGGEGPADSDGGIQSGGEDLLTSLVQARDGSDKLSPRELIATVVLLLNAGHEASVNGFGNGLNSLLTTPGALAPTMAAIADPETGQAATDRLVEEMLRHDSPLHLFERTATQDLEVQGVQIAEGQKIAALLGAANRDPELFDRPDEFDPTREANPHLAFGAGIHFCIGAPLARLELSISVRSLLERLGPIEVVESERRPTFVLRGFERLVIAKAG